MRDGNIVSCPRNKHMFRCDQNGPPARRSEPDWRKEGAYLNGNVTDEHRSRRPIFIATLWAVASWLFFRVARSLRIDSRCARRNRQSGSDRLEKKPTDLRRNTCLFRGQATGLHRSRTSRNRSYHLSHLRNEAGCSSVTRYDPETSMGGE